MTAAFATGKTKTNEAVPVASAQKRILVVDDNKDAADSFVLILQRMGQSARAVYHSSDVFETMRSFMPHIVFLDIGLPGLDGYRISRMIRDELGYDALKIVAVTAYAQDSDRVKARQAGFDAHVAKPVDYSIIESILKTIDPA
jgi:CheY-like chemotaxis protein